MATPHGGNPFSHRVVSDQKTRIIHTPLVRVPKSTTPATKSVPVPKPTTPAPIIVHKTNVAVLDTNPKPHRLKVIHFNITTDHQEDTISASESDSAVIISTMDKHKGHIIRCPVNPPIGTHYYVTRIFAFPMEELTKDDNSMLYTKGDNSESGWIFTLTPGYSLHLVYFGEGIWVPM
uniref:Uncharacterized protein n=1 Tax=Marseillevirus LCMAC101 TaxID=2506602 RepID=A0A481YSC3_9VIRU|nr:MAG: hypothetical protein LCMAC101_04520 [Marseillevirus LCMAC101]